ncbi:MAG: hypothetical protein WCA46_19265, partial [Actinocatenispora sp.]
AGDRSPGGTPYAARSAAAPLAAGPGHTSLVRDRPVATTPDIHDGEVHAILQIGDLMLAGGTFTQASSADSDTVQSRPYLLGFGHDDGKLATTFAPTVNGEVDALLPGPTAGTVYIGGQFGTVDGVAQKGVALLRLADGSLVRSFDPPYVNGIVHRLALVNGHLLLGGTFHTVDGADRSGLASLDPDTGALDDYLTVQLEGHHNYDGSGAKGTVGAESWAVTPDRHTMLVIGNFRTANGSPHDQIVRLTLDTGSARVDAGFATTSFGAACNRSAFDSWVRDVAVSPDGRYFVVAATGGPAGTDLCDSVSRWETAAAGADVAPTWVTHSGGDTFLSTAITEQAVYVGGHFRWLNNTAGHDSAGAGAIGRASIAALEPASGLPDAWNGGRNPRGFGITALYPTPDGLWLGYDTDYLGNFQYRRERVGFYPLRGGTAPHGTGTAGLPGTVYLASPGGTSDTLVSRSYDGGSTVGPTVAVPAGDGTAWHRTRGAFWAGGDLYSVDSAGTLTRRGFDGDTLGAAQTLDPYHDAYWDDVSTGSGQTYRGVPSGFFTELGSVTSVTYLAGRLCYTLSGSSSLYWRWFDPDSGAIGADRHQGLGTFGSARGMFAAGSWWYRVDTAGNLVRYQVSGGLPTGSGSTVSGPSHDGKDWRAAALFVGP